MCSASDSVWDAWHPKEYMAVPALKELTYRKENQSHLERVSTECKWWLEPRMRFRDRAWEEVIFPAKAGEGYKGAKAVGTDLGVAKAVKQIRSTTSKEKTRSLTVWWQETTWILWETGRNASWWCLARGKEVSTILWICAVFSECGRQNAGQVVRLRTQASELVTTEQQVAWKHRPTEGVGLTTGLAAGLGVRCGQEESGMNARIWSITNFIHPFICSLPSPPTSTFYVLLWIHCGFI